MHMHSTYFYFITANFVFDIIILIIYWFIFLAFRYGSCSSDSILCLFFVSLIFLICHGLVSQHGKKIAQMKNANRNEKYNDANIIFAMVINRQILWWISMCANNVTIFKKEKNTTKTVKLGTDIQKWLYFVFKSLVEWEWTTL